jgi:Ca-activated chloride channel family protein
MLNLNKVGWQKWRTWRGLIKVGCLLLAGLVGLCAGQSVLAQMRPDLNTQADKTLSPYFQVVSEDPGLDALPLKSSNAEVNLTGMTAEVKITQVYKNQGKKNLEAIYVFPGSTHAAVHALRMKVGERVVEARIMEREQARQNYNQAKDEGKTASLLEQQRPNVFQMNVANILPGDTVEVELHYLELLQPENQEYEFVLPTVVGPRYSKMPAAGAPDTEKWVQNPYLHQGEAPPYSVGLKVNLRNGLPISRLASPSHDVDITYSGPHTAQVRVKDEKNAGNRDFVLRYALSGNKIETGLLLYPDQKENFFLLMLEPPARVGAEAVVPREYLFIVDVSGSMHGFPLDVTKTLMRDLVKSLKPRDFINVLLFESNSAVLSESGSLPATEARLEKVLGFIQAQGGGGGTNISSAFRRALALPRTPGVSRIVVVATDGYVHVENEVFDLIRQNLGTANLFPFGIGSSVNRHLIEGMARAGMGEPFIVLNQQEAGKQAARFREYIAKPVLTDIKVDFRGFPVQEVEPKFLPDLFALRPLTLLGKYSGQPGGEILISGKTAQGPFQQTIKVTPETASPENSALRLLWARQRVMRLVDLGLEDKDGKIKAEVTRLGLTHSLMTPFTSFVAVDQVKRADGQVVTVKQPLPLPQGVSDLAVGGHGFKGSRKLKMGPGIPTASLAFLPRVEGQALESDPFPPPKGQEPKIVAKFTFQVLRATGGLAADAVQAVLTTGLADWQEQYQQKFQQGAGLPRELNLSFRVNTLGRILGDPAIENSLKDQELRKRLLEALKDLKFASPSQRSAVVTVKLIFPQ